MHLPTSTGSSFAFTLRGPDKLISSRFRISSDSFIDMDSLFSFFVLCASLALAISSPGALHGQRGNRQCFRSSLCSDSEDVCHCEGKCAERRTSSRKGCPCRPAHWLCFVASAPVGEKDLKTQKTHLWGCLWIPRTFEGNVQRPHISVQFLSRGALLK